MYILCFVYFVFAPFFLLARLKFAASDANVQSKMVTEERSCFLYISSERKQDAR